MNNISNRYKRMEQFLKRWGQIALENPNVSFDDSNITNAIYHELIRLGVSEQEKRYDLSREGVFNRWIEDFRNVSNINVFVADNWPYFCQFVNRREEFANGKNEAIKVYIPLDRLHIEHGATMIFDFLAKKNIAHVSKIGKAIRFDNIVVRLKSEEDARELLDFVNSQPYLQEGLISPNPFAFNNNNIAMACDRKRSYNFTICSLISAYLSQRKKENGLNKVGLPDFVKFAYSFYKERFEDFTNLDDTMRRFDIPNEGNDLSTNEAIINAKEVVDLFLVGMQPMFFYRNYMGEFRKRANVSSFEEQARNLQNIRARSNVLEDEVTIPIDRNASELDILNNLMLDAVDTMTEKYDKGRALGSIEKYLLTGTSALLTRTNDIRTKVTSSRFREIFNSILQRHNISFRDYYSLLYLEKGKELKYLEDAVLATYDQFEKNFQSGIEGKKVVVESLKNIVQFGNYNGIINGNNSRDRLQKHVFPNEVLEIMRKKTGFPRNGANLSDMECRILADEYITRVLADRKEKANGKTAA